MSGGTPIAAGTGHASQRRYRTLSAIALQPFLRGARVCGRRKC
jgi:hypothetical protein